MVRTLVVTLLLAFAAAAPARAADSFFDVGKLPPPPLSGQQIAGDLESFVTTYSPRATGTPGEAEAGEFLRAEMASLGYQAETVQIPVQGSDPAGVLRAVVAIRPGRTKPDEHLVFMGHYDTVAGFGGATLQGAYDNGAGTTMIRALAKSFAQAPTNRTLVFVFYNGEEEGLLASQRHAAAWQETGKAVRAVFGFDMTGIAYPVASPGDRNCLCIWHGDEDEDMEPLLRHVNYDVLGFPEAENLVHIVGVNERNSDESSWDALGYRSLRWAGMRAASDYPAYHMPDDTMATIDTVAGGRAYFEQGLRNTLLSSYLTAMSLDSEMPVARAAATGTRPVRFDASGSTDPDGTPSAYEWDFGDGTHGTGLTATHTYARGGDYTATLTVRDNLHPQVTSTSTAFVRADGPPKKKAAKKKSCAKKKTRKARKRCRRKRARRA
jgi:hypothetical protein